MTVGERTTMQHSTAPYPKPATLGPARSREPNESEVLA